MWPGDVRRRRGRVPGDAGGRNGGPGSSTPSGRPYPGGRVAVGIRPEDVRDSGADAGVPVRGRVLLVEALGAEQLVHLEIAATPLDRPELVDAAARPPGPTLALGERGRTATLLGRFDRSALLLRPGDAAEVAVDSRRLHFFDLETGAALESVPLRVPATMTG